MFEVAAAYERQRGRSSKLRDRLRQNLFGDRADGPFTLQAKAWAVLGIAP